MRFCLALLLVTACSSPPPERPEAPLRYLALGDSYTIGEGVAEVERWPAQLAGVLRRDGVAVEAPQIVATTGWTTDELAAALDAAPPDGPFALVTLLIGVNNQYRGRSVDAYRAEFHALLDRAIGYAGGEAGRVVVVSIPDWGVTPFGQSRDPEKIAREIDAFNAAAQQEAAARGAAYVNVTALSRILPDAVAPDGLHPSGAQYDAWANAILPAARAALAHE